MSTTHSNLAEMSRGDNVQIDVTYTTDGDLTGASTSCTWRDSAGGIVFTRRNLAAGGDAAQVAITSGPNGTFSIYVVPANTTGLLLAAGASQTLRYDVQVTTAAGLVHTILDGTMAVVGDAT